MKSMKKLWIFVFSFFVLFLLNTSFVSAKLLPRAKSAGGGGAVTTSSTVGVSAKLTNYKRTLVVYFSGLQNATSVNYSLSYETNGKTEGVGGTIKSSGSSYASRELTFGTCSSGTCRYHTNITNAKLVVTISLKSGSISTRKFKIKI